MRSTTGRALRRRLAPWVKAAALSAVVGSRSLLVPALVSRNAGRAAARVWSVLSALEMAADKTSWIPSRTAPVSLAGRMLVGAAVAVGSLASGRDRRRSALVAQVGSALLGASCAAASAFLLHAWRARLGRRAAGAANAVGGLIEDVIAFESARALMRS